MDSKTKYRISVLMDLAESSKTALQNAVELAKTLGGSVEAIYIKSPLDVVKQENQLSAKKDIYEDSREAKNMLRGLLENIGKQEGIPINYKINYGNVKNKLNEYLETANPDILVMEKRKYRSVGGVGGSTNLLILNDDVPFHSFKDISLGIFGDAWQQESNDIIQQLKKGTTKPLRLFSISNKQTEAQDAEQQTKETVSYTFSEGVNAMDGLASYVKRTKTQLFCIPKGKSSKFLFQNTQTEQILRKVDVPVLVIS